MEAQELDAGSKESSERAASGRERPLRRILPDSWLAIGLGLVALGVYFKTLCPTIYTDDCGEITTAVATGGVIHPPGYPLYCLLGGLFIHLLPFGEPAWRLGLLSSLAGAATVSLVFLLGRRLGASGLWAAVAALAVAFSYTLWQQATKVETYALNACFVAIILNLTVAYSQTGKRCIFLWLAASGGLALTNHLTILWLIPAVLWIALPTLFAVERRPWRVLAGSAFLCIAMLSLYDYEVIAARTHPGGQVWGDPSDFARFTLQITGARYHDYFSNLTARDMLHRDLVFVPSWLWRNTGFLLPFALSGLIVLWCGPGRRFAQGLFLAVAGYLACNTLYGIDNIFEYYTPVVLLLAALGACGLDYFAEWLLQKTAGQAQGPLRGLAGACALLMLALLPAAQNWRLCDRSHALFVRTTAEDTLNLLPPGAVLVVSGDNRIFPLWYLQDVLGIRRDVLVLPRDFLWNLDTPEGRETNRWYLKKLAARDRTIDPNKLLADCARNRAYALSDGPIWQIAREKWQAGRPVDIGEIVAGDVARSSDGRGVFRWIGLPVTPVPDGLSYRLVPASDPPSESQVLAANLALEARMHISLVPREIFVGEPDGPFSDILYARCLTQIGEMLIRENRFADASTELGAATTLDPGSAPAADDYAIACMGIGQTDQALKLWQRAIALDPKNAAYRSNLATAMAQVARAGRSSDTKAQSGPRPAPEN